MSEELQPPDRQSRTKNIPRNLKPYFLAFLTKGPRWNDPAGGEDLQPKQLAFLRQQMESGKYIVAGPVTDGGDMVGVAIVEAATLEEATAIASEDPGVISGRLHIQVRPAYLPSLAGVMVEF